MAKKKKPKVVDIAVAPFAQVKKDLVRKLSSLSDKKLITVGACAVLRLLPKNVFGLIVTSKKLCSPLFHEINLLCDIHNIPVLSIEEEFIKELKAKTNRISIIGVKKKEYSEDREFLQCVLKLRKKKKNNVLDELREEVHSELEKVSKSEIRLNESSSVLSSPAVNYCYQTKTIREKSTETVKTFISLNDNCENKLEFPAYKPFYNVENLIVRIKDNETLSYILNS